LINESRAAGESANWGFGGLVHESAKLAQTTARREAQKAEWDLIAGLL
jgi:hypothetical protein